VEKEEDHRQIKHGPVYVHHKKNNIITTHNTSNVTSDIILQKSKYTEIKRRE